MDWEFEVGKCKLLYIEWINNKVLLYSTGNYILCYILYILYILYIYIYLYILYIFYILYPVLYIIYFPGIKHNGKKYKKE